MTRFGRLVKEASEEFRAAIRSTERTTAGGPAHAAEAEAFKRALERLVKVLAGSAAKRFRIASTSHKGLEYQIVGPTPT